LEGAACEIRGHELHAFAERLQPLARDRQHLGREIEQREASVRERLGDHRRQESRAGAEIEQFETIVSREGQQFERGAIEIVEARNRSATRTIVAIRVSRKPLANRLDHAASLADSVRPRRVSAGAQ